MNDILKLSEVSYVYGKGTPFEKTALSDVSVSFKRGRITGLIGHTGSGKSTLVNLLNGLNRPTEGSVLLDGVDIWENPKEISKVRFRVGLVMQYPEYQLFDETVALDIGFGPRNQGLSPEEVDLRVREAASFVGLDPELLRENYDKTLRIPMLDTLRCLNLSNSVAVAVYEVLRQRDFDMLSSDGSKYGALWE